MIPELFRLTTGVDLVESQLRHAAGLDVSLPDSQVAQFQKTSEAASKVVAAKGAGHNIIGDPRPAVAFDSPYRIRKSLAIISEVMPERHLTLARELTKLHEQIVRGTAAEAMAELADPTRGEITLVISGE